MLKKYKVVILVVVMVSGIAAININNDKLFEITKNLEIFVSVYKELNTNFADELDPSTLMRTAIDAMTTSLDPYTNFFSESQAESYWINDDERYQGIGAKIDIIDNRLTIVEPYEKGPADKAGIKAGDIITSIDGNNVQSKKMDEINVMLRGLPGTDVQIGIQSASSNKSDVKKITRGEVNIPNVPYSGFVEGNVGYIALTTFTQMAGSNIQKALKDLKEDNPNLSGVIIDLRHNGGGLLHEAVNICNIFIPRDEIVVTTKSKIKERDQTFKTTDNPVDLDLPLAVLIDGRSASASEIVSGVMQDLDRGVLIGQRSFGKGLVQNTKDLPYNARLKLTTSKYYIPSGRCIQGVEYEHGVPKNIPDSQRSKFKTKNNRVVLDGGGVSPDIITDQKELLPVTQALLDQYIIFDYVNQWVKNRDSIGSIDKFKFTQFEDFVNFAKKKNFTFTSNGERALQDAKKAFESTKDILYAEEIQKLENKIIQAKGNEFIRAKDQIVYELEKEIVTRYYLQKGKIQYSLRDDHNIKEAASVLKDSKRYKKILNSK